MHRVAPTNRLHEKPNFHSPIGVLRKICKRSNLSTVYEYRNEITFARNKVQMGSVRMIVKASPTARNLRQENVNPTLNPFIMPRNK